MNLMLASLLPDDKVLATLLIAIIVVAILLGIAIVAAYIARIVLLLKYSKYNKIENSEHYTAVEAARHFLDKCDLKEVQVEKCNLLRWLIWGNSYSSRQKKIFLRGNIVDKKTLTAVGIALSKVGLAIQDRDGEKKFKFVNFMRKATVFAPYLFIPLGALGVILDLFVAGVGGVGIFTSIFTGIAVLYYLLAFVFTILTIPVERKAHKMALTLMERVEFLTPGEREDIKNLFNTYIAMYIIDFIVSLLYLIYYILKFLLKAVALKKK